jgi:hypothetical protein
MPEDKGFRTTSVLLALGQGDPESGGRKPFAFASGNPAFGTQPK